MNDWTFIVILAAIGFSVFYVRKYIGTKAESLAHKEDLRELTDIVERVRTQFDRANLVHRVQFEAEFRACQDAWHATEYRVPSFTSQISDRKLLAHFTD